MPGRLGGTSRICRKAVNNGEDPVRATSKRPHGIPRFRSRSAWLLRQGSAQADANLQRAEKGADGTEKAGEKTHC